MKKAVLVMDMPECCGECQLMDDDYAGGYCNAHDDDYIDIPDTMGGKPNWCPLQEMPEKKDITPLGTESYVSGWNDDGGLQPIEKCPFCGGSAKLCDNGFEAPIIEPDSGAYVDMEISEGDIFWCECESCGAATCGKGSPEAAITEWNHRVN